MAPPPTSGSQPDSADTPLDERLARSAPSGTPATPELEEELSRLSVRTREEARGRRRAGRFRLSRGAAIGIAALVLLGGGASAAAVVELRSYWENLGAEPHGSYGFELPSGAECEVERRLLSQDVPAGVENVDDFSMTDEQDSFAREMYSDAQQRVDDFITTEEFQERFEAQKVFPSDFEWTDDAAYFHAVDRMLSGQLHNENREEMQEVGVGGSPMGHSCPGADFGGSWLSEYGDMDAHEDQREESGGCAAPATPQWKKR